MISIKVDAGDVFSRQLSDLERKQLPFATVQAINATAFDVRERWKDIAGQEARTRLPEWRGVRTPYALAEQVFTQASLPQYQRAARRAVGPGYDDLSPGAQAALTSLGYNRGWSILGNRRIQMRKIAKVCVPARDEPCIARELREMCQLWAGTANGAGLCARRQDEARYVEGT